MVKQLFSFVYCSVIVALLGLHFVFKDHNLKTAVWFYAFPLPVIILLATLASVLLPKRIRRYNVLFVAVLTATWLLRSFSVALPLKKTTDTAEVVFWNASQHHDFNTAFKINGGRPDVAVLVECGDSAIAHLKTSHPDYFVYQDTIAHIGIYAKTPVQIINTFHSRYQSAVIHFKTKGIQFYAVDVSGSMDVPRSWELDFVSKTLVTTNKTVVMGDFNVPIESVLLDGLKSRLDNAFVKQSNGFRETWCWGFPLLSLDQIWLSKDFKETYVSKKHTLQSDHALLRLLIQL